MVNKPSPLSTEDLRRVIVGNADFWIGMLQLLPKNDKGIHLTPELVGILKRDMQCIKELLGERWGGV